MHFETIQPSAFLAPIIKHYWVIEKNALEPDVCERVIPTGTVQFLFHYRTPFIVFETDKSIVNQPRSLVSGLSQTFADVAAVDNSGVLAVTFQPWGACHILPFSLAEIENTQIGLSEVFGNEIIKLENLLNKATCTMQRVYHIEKFLLNHLITHKPHDISFVNQSLKYIFQEKGMLTTQALERQLGMSGRNVERKFAKMIGKTPKQYSKLVRFQSVIRELSNTKPIDWAQLAYAFGYADQSHLIKDFRTITGLTPVLFQAQCCNQFTAPDFIV
jgi:AraC-like DNA-binding protein